MQLCVAAGIFNFYCISALGAVVHQWASEDSLCERASLFYHVGPRDYIQVLSLGSKGLYPHGHLASPVLSSV